jgi:hypothetical protein
MGQSNRKIKEQRYIPVGRTDGSTEGTEGRIDATVILSCNFNRGNKMKQRIARGERRKKQLKTHLTLCSELKRRSMIQDSSAHLLFFVTESEMSLTNS